MTMQNLTMAGNTLMQMQAMQSASTKLQGRANVLKSELKTDKNPSENKKAQVEELENRAHDVMGQLMEQAQKTNEKLNQDSMDKNKKDEEDNVKLNQASQDKNKKDENDKEEVLVKDSDRDSGYRYTNTGMAQAEPSSPLKIDVTV